MKSLDWKGPEIPSTCTPVEKGLIQLWRTKADAFRIGRLTDGADAFEACANDLQAAVIRTATFGASTKEESITDSMDRLHHEKHAKFRRWQDAMLMNQIFGDNYATVPEIPKGYEAYAKWWYDTEFKAFK